MQGGHGLVDVHAGPVYGDARLLELPQQLAIRSKGNDTTTAAGPVRLRRVNGELRPDSAADAT